MPPLRLARHFARIEAGFCKLDPELVWCDVQTFASLCQRAAQPGAAVAISAGEQARQLYRGDLLVEMPYPWLHERDSSGMSLQERYRDDYCGPDRRACPPLYGRGTPAAGGAALQRVAAP
jgi:hypothetical protein